MTEDVYTHPQVGVQGRLADAVLAYASLAADMAHVRILLGELLARPPVPEGEADWPAVALWQAALIAYARSFGSGRRKGFANRVPVPDELREDHKRMRALRDAHIAHFTQENEAEPGVVMLMLDLRQPGEPVVGAGHLLARQLQSADDAPGRLLVLAAHFEAAYALLVADAHQRLIELAKQRPADEVLAAHRRGSVIRIDEDGQAIV